MFQHLKNIDSAFSHIRLFSILVIVCCTTISLYSIWKGFNATAQAKEKIYVLAGGKGLEALGSDRKSNIPVEARDHIATFHIRFFNLSPDEKAIQSTLTKAMYLADASAKRQYDNLKENGYYSGIVAGNISQEFILDSIQLNSDSYPYHFTCFGHQRIIRSSSIAIRTLITSGYLRNVDRSENNPHGFLIEKWEITENKNSNEQSR